MRNEVIAVVLVILVAGSLCVGYFSGSNTRQTTRTVFISTTATVQAPFSPCGEKFSYDTANPISVLMTNTNTTGQICVEYRNTLNNSVSIPTYTSVYEYNKSGSYGVCPSCSFNVVTSIRVTASQSVVTFVPSASPSSEVANVTYTITIPSNATKGIYGISLLQFCSLFPLVVSQNGGPVISKSDFASWYPHQGSCPDQMLEAQVLGVGGFSSVVSMY